MAFSKPSLLLLVLGFSFAKSHLAYIGVPNKLHPVHSLYVKPSNDGVTGDLYVAATEDHGIKSQWLTDHPVNFLQSLPGSQPLASYSAALTTQHLPHDETIVTNQKRAVITSPAVKYTYAVPESKVPYPYTVASTPVTTPTEGTECTDPASVYSYPYNLYYAQMMAAFANAWSNMKENNSGEETATAAAPVWPSYPYPIQYVMVDPSAWAKAQTTPAQTTTTPAPDTAADTASEESA